MGLNKLVSRCLADLSVLIIIGNNSTHFFLILIQLNLYSTETQRGRGHKNLRMAFDKVYHGDDSNSFMFEDVMIPAIDSLLAGFNCSG